MTQCSICGAKAKRTCQLRGPAPICPRCCGAGRTAECAGCAHYTASQQYHRLRDAGRSPTFMPELQPHLDRKIDEALGHIEQGRYALARSLLDELAAVASGYYMLDFALGTLHARNDKLDEAIICFDRAIDKFPRFMEAHFNRGMAFKKRLDIPNAVHSFRKVVQTGDADDENVRWARGFLRDMEQSIRRTEGIDLDTYIEAHEAFDRGVECMNRLEWEKALSHFECCAPLNPRSPKAYGNIGLCQAKLGRNREALAALDKAIEIDPAYEPALLNRAAISEGTNMPDGAIPMINYAIDYQAAKKSLIREVLDSLRSKGAS